MKLYGILYITVWCLFREITDTESAIYCFKMLTVDESCDGKLNRTYEDIFSCCAMDDVLGYAESLQTSDSDAGTFHCTPCPRKKDETSAPPSQSIYASLKVFQMGLDAVKQAVGSNSYSGQAIGDSLDGSWSVWGEWTPCSESCGEGARERSRTCDDPAPEHGDEPCRGDEKETSGCTVVENCPVNGGWSAWTRYGSCRANPCKSFPGYKFKTRECDNPVPSYGGATCDGIKVERELCYNTHRCPMSVDGGWCPWSSWGECVGEQRTRSRGCECPSPHRGGHQCLKNKDTGERGMLTEDFKDCSASEGSGSGQGEDDEADNGGSEEVDDREP